MPKAIVNAVIAPGPTNIPLVINFSTNQFLWFTNTITRTVTDRTAVNAVATWDTNITTTVTQRLPLSPISSYRFTLFTGTDHVAAFVATNLPSVTTNRSPVTFSVSPTNRYIITMWGNQADGQPRFLAQADFPSAPSNVVTFLILPLFADRIDLPENEWRAGTNIFALSVTNPTGGNQFMRASVRVVKDDFTPKAVSFGDTFQLFPTNP